MTPLLSCCDEVTLSLDKIEKAMFMVSDIQEDAFGGYKEPNLAAYGDSTIMRNSVHLEMVHDYLIAVKNQLMGVNDKLSELLSAAEPVAV